MIKIKLDNDEIEIINLDFDKSTIDFKWTDKRYEGVCSIPIDMQGFLQSLPNLADVFGKHADKAKLRAKVRKGD